MSLSRHDIWFLHLSMQLCVSGHALMIKIHLRSSERRVMSRIRTQFTGNISQDIFGWIQTTYAEGGLFKLLLVKNASPLHNDTNGAVLSMTMASYVTGVEIGNHSDGQSMKQQQVHRRWD